MISWGPMDFIKWLRKCRFWQLFSGNQGPNQVLCACGCIWGCMCVFVLYCLCMQMFKCVCVCVSVRVHAYHGACMEVTGKPQVLVLTFHLINAASCSVLCLSWKQASWAMRSQEFSHLTMGVLGLQVWETSSGFMGSWKFKHSFFYFWGKWFIHWTLSLAPGFISQYKTFFHFYIQKKWGQIVVHSVLLLLKYAALFSHSVFQQVFVENSLYCIFW